MILFTKTYETNICSTVLIVYLNPKMFAEPNYFTNTFWPLQLFMDSIVKVNCHLKEKKKVSCCNGRLFGSCLNTISLYLLHTQMICNTCL